MTALLVIAILVLLIVVHEFGHFISAKIFGVRVDEFGVGYPPRAFLFGKIGDTEYTLNWIPFGGFVRLFGEEEEHGRGSFSDAPRWKQAIILVAGVVMNALAAWALFSGAYMIGILHPVDTPGPRSMLIVSEVVPASPVESAGIVPGSEILAVSGVDGSVPAELTPQGVSDFIAERPGKEIEITYKTLEGATSTRTVRPAHAVISDTAGRPAVGMGLLLAESEALSFPDAVKAGADRTLRTFVVVGDGIYTLIRDAVRGAADLQNVVGPIGLVSAVGQAKDNGWGYVLSLAAFISVNLTLINLIPIPALDGGRLLIVAVESVIRRRASRLAVQLLNALGLALVIMLMVTVTYNDIARLFA